MPVTCRSVAFTWRVVIYTWEQRQFSASNWITSNVHRRRSAIDFILKWSRRLVNNHAKEGQRNGFKADSDIYVLEPCWKRGYYRVRWGDKEKDEKKDIQIYRRRRGEELRVTMKKERKKERKKENDKREQKWDEGGKKQKIDHPKKERKKERKKMTWERKSLHV